MSTPITNLLTLDAYVASRSHVFASVASLRWFERTHRDELIKAGAILLLAGRKMIDPDAFDSALATIGRRLAQARTYTKASSCN